MFKTKRLENDFKKLSFRIGGEVFMISTGEKGKAKVK
jgi:hypothetical protein